MMQKSQKIIIQNRKNQNMVVLLENQDGQAGLAFILHGLGGYKEQPHIIAIAGTLLEQGYVVARYDATNALGDSDGEYENASITSYYEDLEDVIQWASSQDWYKEPFILAGHSLGGISVALFAERFPEKVKALAPLSTVVAWDLSKETEFYKDRLERWEKDGYTTTRHSKTGDQPWHLKWSHVEDLMKYDLLNNVDKLTMPVLLIVGDKDTATPLDHQKILYNALPGRKELHIIKGSPHTFRKPEHTEEVKRLFTLWLRSLV